MSSAGGRPDSGRRNTAPAPRRPSSAGGSDKEEHNKIDDTVRVCVRFRPLTQPELDRRENEVWGQVDGNHVGVIGRFGITTKYAYDTVFGPSAGNAEVYQTMVSDIISSVPESINGTVFAYGVTSSGKTYTMHGKGSQGEKDGMVSRSLTQLFEHIEKDTERDYMARLSYVEIYNEVINDLLDKDRKNLQVVDDVVRGQVVQGATEHVILNASSAMSLVNRGEALRKVSATAANKGSSRSHTYVRITVESSCSLAGSDASSKAGGGSLTRRYSALNLIDLAGSEAAKVQQNKLQSREGSYINKSLLALGTVIAKLGDQKAVHIPFRDSKLTRLLASSLSGSGARVCVICTATPSATQAEETHNTLKFATRAKAVRVSVHRHERSNARELLMRYQQEVADLRQQLWRLENGLDTLPASLQGTPRPGTPCQSASCSRIPLSPRSQPDMSSLAEILELKEQLEEERAVRLVHEREKAELQDKVKRLSKVILHSGTSSKPPSSHQEVEVNLVDAEVSTADEQLGLSEICRSGGLENSEVLASGGYECSYVDTILCMREQMLALTDELDERDKQLGNLREHGESILVDSSRMRAEAEIGADVSLDGAAERAAAEEVERDIEIQVLQSDRDVLHQQLQGLRMENDNLRAAHYGQADAVNRLARMEAQVAGVFAELANKDQQLAMERNTLERFRQIEQQVEAQLQQTSEENVLLRTDLTRLEQQNNHLQGYLLDGMSAGDLSQLIRTLTQAVERVRITVQMRRLSTGASTGPSPQMSPSRQTSLSPRAIPPAMNLGAPPGPSPGSAAAHKSPRQQTSPLSPRRNVPSYAPALWSASSAPPAHPPAQPARQDGRAARALQAGSQPVAQQLPQPTSSYRQGPAAEAQASAAENLAFSVPPPSVPFPTPPEWS